MEIEALQAGPFCATLLPPVFNLSVSCETCEGGDSGAFDSGK